jgi:NAD(P)-dependent dehydrogenase (short-subunit alcohol dehydrogenase family)
MNVLITGGEQGLGKGIVDAILSDHDPETNVVNISGQRIRRWHPDEFGTLQTSGPYDVVINNFGINHLSRLGETHFSDSEIMRVNVMIPYWVMNALAQSQPKHPTKVINIASQTYRIPQRNTALYCASKAALVQLSKVAAREMAPHWQVNCVAPGRIVGTEMDRLTQTQVRELRGWDQEEADRYAESLIPMGRFTTVDEVVRVVLGALVMPNYVSGTVIEAFGGV